MASFRPSRKGLAIAGAVAVGVIAMPTAASAAGVGDLLGLGDLLTLLDGHNAALCSLDGLLSIDVQGGACADGSVQVSLSNIKGDPGTNGTNGT
ncbi:MAG TPA: hypothetical protein VGL04_11750, partial [Sporichthyaceae bacterium]